MARTDTERLDWLEAKGEGREWHCRESTTGRGYRLLTSSHADRKPTVRDAIDAAMDAEGGEPTR